MKDVLGSLSDLLPKGGTNDPTELDKAWPGMDIRILCTGIKGETGGLGIKDKISSYTSYLSPPFPDPAAIRLPEQSSKIVHPRPEHHLHGW